MSLKYVVRGTVAWIKADWRSNHFRFIVEVIAWALSISCAVIMAVTIPNPPFIFLYPMFIAGCALYGWTAYSRNSFGMLVNYLLLVTIDTIGYIRLFL